MIQINDYQGREQAFVKHYVLTHYIESLALKIGNFKPGTTLNFIDGFSGPWQSVTEELRDTSPHVALTKLLEARRYLMRTGKDLTIRGFFVERESAAHARLTSLLRDFSEIETESRHGCFEDMISDAVTFATTGRNPFAFVFIDPTGWTGYGLNKVVPLLRVKPSEVLINFMTKDIMRFIDDTSSTALDSFVDLFGDAAYREDWRGLDGLDREDRIVDAYRTRLRNAGGFAHVAASVILHPRHDRTHYHLIHATRSIHGLITFRETERKALPQQQSARADAKQRHRVDSRAQRELFDATTMESSNYMEELIARYHDRAFKAVAEHLQTHRSASFDELVALALDFPMTSLVDINRWFVDHYRKGIVRFRIPEGDRSLKIQKGHRIEWIGESKS